MNDLISRSALLKYCRKVVEYDEAGYSVTFNAVSVEDIKNEPTVEARHTGYWRESDGIFYCSECNNGYKNQPTLMGRPMFEYCPMCGSKMRNNGASRSNDGVNVE